MAARPSVARSSDGTAPRASASAAAGGIDVDEAARITSHLAETGNFDYFAYNQGNFSLSLEQHVPDVYFRPGHFIDLHKQIRPHAKGLPVMAVGRINTPELAERILAEGYADLVGMSRALIADAAFWPRPGTDGPARSGLRSSTTSPGAKFMSASRWKSLRTPAWA